MKKQIFLCTLTLAALLSGCIPSLYPIYTDEVLTFEERLLGDWQGDDNTWTFQRGKGQSYQLLLTDTDEGSTEVYATHLVKLGPYYFLDFYPDRELTSRCEFSLMPMIPCHSFARLDWDEARQPQITMFDYDWLENLVENRQIRIRHERTTDGTIVLTASPEEMQKFLLKYAEEKEALSETLTLVRTK